ncbi:uncharacterized protein C5L36_0A11070 [Pichia kudriavzevii]|uniref:Pre-mRNA-splicing factor CLF1 n=1 Tax=Pichia kudriavzevii TaxID=4909 RepID=A0A099P8S5_PICKU|nr:uncharacterized protein C5L36_0A11070 [Pichia kudriavzevii]AWU74524.1 hypothetical protein C5L36_0A11070 [Pichia kudriavzevii]KGK40697.1 hypothetical protein JL09_g89 [Pichia kudriavzevii]ONH74384.1 Pre-mRNA-splicing factor CLF1 [Pichia kudriavzevii]
MLKRESNDGQFTASKLLQSAYESSKHDLKVADFKITDLEELHYMQRRKRTEFENAIRRNRFNFGQWMRYAQFEIDQKDYARARSVFERAIEVDYKNVPLWIRYIQSEIKLKNINHARNLLERAIKLLPRIDKFWYLYVTIEESIGNVTAVSHIFDKWLNWKPNKDVWLHYLEFEERYEEYEEERLIFEKFVKEFNDSDSWLRWVQFEKTHGDEINVGNVFKLGVKSLHSVNRLDSQFLISWIRFQYSLKQADNVKQLYEFGYDALNREEANKLQKFETDFQKKYGLDSASLDQLVLLKRKVTYEEKLEQDKQDWSTWWLYLSLLIDTLKVPNDEVIEKFKVCMSTQPQSFKVSEWCGYWYICKRYLLFVEFEVGSVDDSRSIYSELIKTIPHKNMFLFDFWKNIAEFELRNGDLAHMRKVLGQGIGFTENEEIIKYYISIELRLKYFDRARKLYNKLIELFPDKYKNWIEYFDFEESLGNELRSFSILEVAVFENFLDNKAKLKLIRNTIDKVTENYNFRLARRLLDYKVTIGNVNAKIERSLLELKIPSEDQIREYGSNAEVEFTIDESVKNRVRKEYERFLSGLKENAHDRIVMLESLKRFEQEYGDEEKVKQVEARLPRIIRRVKDGEDCKEEIIEYIFPEDENEIQQQVEEFKNAFLQDEQEDEEEVDEGGRKDDVEDGDEDEDEEGGERDEEENQSRIERRETKERKSFRSRFESSSEDEA